MLQGAVAERVEESMPEVAQRLVAELHVRGVTYQAIADELGVTVRTVYRWSKAQTPPLHAKLLKISRTWGVPRLAYRSTTWRKGSGHPRKTAPCARLLGVDYADTQ